MKKLLSIPIIMLMMSCASFSEQNKEEALSGHNPPESEQHGRSAASDPISPYYNIIGDR